MDIHKHDSEDCMELIVDSCEQHYCNKSAERIKGGETKRTYLNIRKRSGNVYNAEYKSISLPEKWNILF